MFGVHLWEPIPQLIHNVVGWFYIRVVQNEMDHLKCIVTMSFDVVFILSLFELVQQFFENNIRVDLNLFQEFLILSVKFIVGIDYEKQNYQQELDQIWRKRPLSTW